MTIPGSGLIKMFALVNDVPPPRSGTYVAKIGKIIWNKYTLRSILYFAVQYSSSNSSFINMRGAVARAIAMRTTKMKAQL